MRISDWSSDVCSSDLGGMSQFALPFEWPADPRDDEFLVSSSNAAAVHTLEHWGAWPVMTAILVGPRKSGRSLLARIFVAKSHGRITIGRASCRERVCQYV